MLRKRGQSRRRGHERVATRRTSPVGRGGKALNAAGIGLLALGALLGWMLPLLSFPGSFSPLADRLQAPVPTVGIDVSTYLGAILTASSVLVGVLTGFVASMLQVAAQALAPHAGRPILNSLRPLLIVWAVTTAIVLWYLLYPPAHIAQLWQVLCWFAAVVLLLLAYLWRLPWHLSGTSVADWATQQLYYVPIEEWEAHEAYVTLQTSLASSIQRGDVGTVAALALVVGAWLAELPVPQAAASEDHEANDEAAYRRFRALKNLLLGCAQGAGGAPPFVAYYLGFMTAGALLHHAANSATPGVRNDIFGHLVRTLDGSTERVHALWAGVRHALCRPGPQGLPYLVRFWRMSASWSPGDPRRAEGIASALVRLYLDCSAALPVNTGSVSPHAHQPEPLGLRARLPGGWLLSLQRSSLRRAGRATDIPLTPENGDQGDRAGASSAARQSAPDAEMLNDLYRYLGDYLLPALKSHPQQRDPRELPRELLQALHRRAFPLFAAPSPQRSAVEQQFARYRVLIDSSHIDR